MLKNKQGIPPVKDLNSRSPSWQVNKYSFVNPSIQIKKLLYVNPSIQKKKYIYIYIRKSHH